MNKFNLDKLVKVHVNGFYKSMYYRWYPRIAKKYFWQQEQKQGFYLRFYSSEYKGDKAPENHTLRKGIVYENPEVVLSFQGGYKTTRYFKTLKEANIFSDYITKDMNWIEN